MTMHACRDADIAAPAAPVEFATLLEDEAGGRFAYCRESFRLHPPEDAEVVACEALLDPAVLQAVIDRFATGFAGGDRRAVVSMWTLYYFSTLTIAAAISLFVLRREVPFALADMRLCLSRAQGEPLSFVIGRIGPRRPRIDAAAALHGLLRLHLEPLVEAVARAGGVSKKLLWNNVTGYLLWILDEIAGGDAESEAGRAASLVRTRNWPDGWTNPMHDMLRPAVDDDGAPCIRRKICCLRYALPGVGGCGVSCPLPEGRQQT